MSFPYCRLSAISLIMKSILGDKALLILCFSQDVL